MNEHFEGHIDHSGNGVIFGWVRDTNNSTRRLTVRIELSNGWSRKARADLLRPDLQAQGIGDGYYGFEVEVPFAVTEMRDIKVHASTDEGGYVLMKSGRILVPAFPIAHVAGDITNNCNLRCPFCVTDYALTRSLRSMEVDVFQQTLTLLPLVPDGMFWLSCMHEPTIHPRFAELIELVPLELRQKVSFTTNFCKALPDSTLQSLARSGFDNIRISIDSVDPDRFSALRKGGKLATFQDNLERFSKFLKLSDNPPKVHLITMAFAHNCHEIETVIRKCGSQLPPHSHEVRFIFYQPHIADWGADHILTADQWEHLKSSIQSQEELDFVTFYDPIPGTHQAFDRKHGIDDYTPSSAVFGGNSSPQNYRFADPLENGARLNDEAIPLRLRWDGLIVHEKLSESEFLWNIRDIEAERFIQLRASASRSSEHPWTNCQSASIH